MTVGELIEKLKECDEYAEVVVKGVADIDCFFDSNNEGVSQFGVKSYEICEVDNGDDGFVQLSGSFELDEDVEMVYDEIAPEGFDYDEECDEYIQQRRMEEQMRKRKRKSSADDYDDIY